MNKNTKYLIFAIVIFIAGSLTAAFILNKTQTPILVQEVNPVNILNLQIPANWKGKEKLPGNSFATALDIIPGYDTQGTLNPGNIVDYYAFKIDQPAKINITVSNLPNDFGMVYYDSNFKQIGYTLRNGSISGATTISIQNPGKYYIKVLGNYSEPGNNPYVIRISIQSFFE